MGDNRISMESDLSGDQEKDFRLVMNLAEEAARYPDVHKARNLLAAATIIAGDNDWFQGEVADFVKKYGLG